MKKIFAIISLLALTIVSCNNKPDSDVQDVDKLNSLAADCTRLNATIASLQTLASAIQQDGKLTGFTPVTDENGKVSGYIFTIDESKTVTLYNCPAYVSVGQIDGGYSWKVNGEAVSALGDKNAPAFKVEGESVKMSLDGGSNWTEVAESTTQLIKSVSESASGVEIALDGGAALYLPKPEKLQVELVCDKKEFTPNEAVYVQYKVSGTDEKEVYVETYATNGWVAQIFSTSATEGVIKVVAPEDVSNPSVMIYVTTDAGDAYVAPLDIAATGEAADDPVLSALASAVSVGCEGGEIEVKVSTNLDYEVVTDADWVVCKQTKAVREDAVPFEVGANKSEDARSSVIKFQCGNFYTTCVVLQEADYGEIDNEPQTPVDSDLSKNGTANCYIVNVAGSYSFDASVVGNGEAGIVEGARFHIDETEVNFEPVEVELLWVENDCISDVTLDKTTKRVSFNANGNKGNALIAVYDEYEDIAWSWHIWCTNMPKDVTHKNMNGKEFSLQDRNIGAVSINPNEIEKTHGLFYQWGRKDPFVASKTLASTMIKDPSNDIWGAVMNPTIPFTMLNNTYEWYNGVQSKIEHALWGNDDYSELHEISEYQKSIYDPCPVGYMVPPQDTWAGLAESDLQFISAGFFHLLEGGKKAFYPYAGSVDQGSSSDCGYTGYYNYKAEGSRERYWYCRLWTSGAASYSGKVVGSNQLQVYYDPKEEKYSVTGYVGDMRHRLVPVRCVKMK